MLLSFSFNVKFLKFLDHPIEITGIIRKTGRHVKNSVWTLRHKCLRLFWSNKWTRCILLHDKSEFYGTTLVPFQSKPTQHKNLLKLSLRTSFKHTPPVPKETFLKPDPPNEYFQPMNQKNAHWSICLGIVNWMIFGVFAKLSKIKIYVLYQHGMHLTH